MNRVAKILNQQVTIYGMTGTGRFTDYGLVLELDSWSQSHDFDLRIDVVDGQPTVFRTAGKRLVIDGQWEDVAEKELGTGNGIAWMKYYYTGLLESGESPSTTGWSDGEAEWSATMPTYTNDEAKLFRLFLIATVTNGEIKYHERGSKVVMDLGNCAISS